MSPDFFIFYKITTFECFKTDKDAGSEKSHSVNEISVKNIRDDNSKTRRKAIFCELVYKYVCVLFVCKGKKKNKDVPPLSSPPHITTSHRWTVRLALLTFSHVKLV